MIGMESRGGQNGQPMPLAYLVGHLTHSVVFRDLVLELCSVNEANAVDAIMIVQMLPVYMTCHKHLEAITPHLLCNFDADAVTFLWRNLARLEALIRTIGEYSTLLVELSLCCHHSLIGSLG